MCQVHCVHLLIIMLTGAEADVRYTFHGPIAVSMTECGVFWTKDKLRIYLVRNFKQTLTYLLEI